MNRLILSVLAAATLCAQSTTTLSNPETQNTGQTSSAPTGSTTGVPMGQPQTWTGVLIDASCKDISSMKPAIHTSKVKTDLSSSSSDSPDASSRKSSEKTTTVVADADSATTREDKTTRKSEAQATTDPDTGTRSRTRTESATKETSSTTVSSSDPYPTCRVNSASSSFAVASSGKVYFLDEASNARVRQQLQTDSAFINAIADAKPSPLGVVVMGNSSGPEITVTTLQRRP